MTNVSRTNRNGHRPTSDLYQTPAMCTGALIQVLPDLFKPGARWWEPACGKLAIARVLERHGCRVVCTDKHNHGTSFGGHDFLAEKKLRAPRIMTNWPYGKVTVAGGTINLSDAFIRHALNLNPEYAAFLLPLTYWSGIGRTDILEQRGLWRVVIFRNRPTLSPDHLGLKSGGVTEYAWFVWKRGHVGPPVPVRVTLDKGMAN